jgi:hypothetical protein
MKCQWMDAIDFGKRLAVLTTALTLVAGAAGARADEVRSVGNGGASLTGLTPSVRVAASVTTVPVPTAPVSPAPVSGTPTPPSVAAPTPPTPPTTVVPPGSAAIPAANPPPAADSGSPPAPAPAPSPAASNTTTQTITQVQVSTCVSHCDGGSQVQQASQDNTTVQAVGPPVANDGGTAIAPPPPATRHTSASPGRTPSSTPSTSTPSNPSSPPPSTAANPPPSGVTQVQVGCVEHCYGTTTRDGSGRTLAQVEQLLGELQAPPAPGATAAPGGEQNVTQQAAAQSQSGDGQQSQAASQHNGTVQVVATPAGTAGDGATGPAAVNQTAQGIDQLQVGCLFYCSGTRQTQQAQQSNTTVQSVNSSGAGAVNTVSTGVSQVQVGCLAWCYDTVETQTATGTDSTVVAVAPPVQEPPSARVPVDSPSAPVRVVGAGIGVGLRETVHPVLGGERVTAVSVSVVAGNGAALLSVAASRAVQTQLPRRARHIGRTHRMPRPVHAPQPTAPRSGSTVVARASTADPSPELALALVLMAVAFGVWRWRRVR